MTRVFLANDYLFSYISFVLVLQNLSTGSVVLSTVPNQSNYLVPQSLKLGQQRLSFFGELALKVVLI